MYRKRRSNPIVATLVVALFIIISGALLLNGTRAFLQKDHVRSKQREVDVIRKYAVQCYATEGSYPPNLEYLESHYQLMLNRDEYDYMYEIFAANIAPIITVIPKLEVDRDFLKMENE
ncbi:MAG: hypothetical protein CSB19_01940 [Clostridiales bacterium]|nr:MAG: hypothetical protein CSB19_01940 [Clostridiales bacterium]